MSGPWERFQSRPAPQQGPWTRFQGGARARVDAVIAAGEAGVSPERRARQEQIDARATADITRAGQEHIVSERPGFARAATFLQGVPFVGEYVDEAVGMMAGDGAQERVRAAQGAMEATRPGETAALRVGGAVASLPALSYALPAGLMGGAGRTVLGQMGRAAATGGVLGSAEGAVSGYGAGNDGDRVDAAADRAIVGGALGAGIGAAIPAARAGLRAVIGRFRQSDISTIAREFGISDDAARVARRALQSEDFPAAEAAIRRAGGRAMLADAGDASRNLLDASIATGGRASVVGRGAIDARAAEGGAEFARVLDRFLGRPEGVRTAQAGIRSGSAAARSSAYQQAYAAPIDYSSRAGVRLERLGARVPQAAIARANRMMQVNGEQSAQIMARIADDGTVSFARMPDVRQWDYITRALGDLAESGEARGAMGGMTAESRAITGLSREIRDTLRSHVPAYGRALSEAADTIGQVRATEAGATLLRQSTTRETAREAIRGMTAAERTAARQGLRSYIDDMMAQTQRALTDQNMDAREAVRAWRAMSSRQSQDNMARLLGRARAQQFASEIDRIATDFELRAAVHANSRTAIRTAVQGEAREVTSPGVLDTLLEGRPVESVSRIVAALSGRTEAARSAREAGIFAEITEALTRTRGEAETRRIIGRVGASIGSQPISRARAEYIARQVTGALGGAAYQEGHRSLGSR